MDHNGDGSGSCSDRRPGADRVEQARRAHIGPPVHEELVWLDRLPQLTQQERQRREQCSGTVPNLPGPGLKARIGFAKRSPASPGPGSESVFVPRKNDAPILLNPQAVLRNLDFAKQIPDGHEIQYYGEQRRGCRKTRIFYRQLVCSRSTRAVLTGLTSMIAPVFQSPAATRPPFMIAPRDLCFWMRLVIRLPSGYGKL